MFKKINILLAIAALFLVVPVRAAMAANFTLTPSSGSYQVGQDFQVDLGIASGTVSIVGGDILGTFDASKLELKSGVLLDTTNFSSDIVADIDNTAGTFVFMLAPIDAYKSAVINGPVIKLTFAGKTAGTGVVNFTCTGTSYDDSNILDSNNADVIVCSSNQSGSYTFTGVGGDDTTDPAPTEAAVTATGETTTAAELPKTGSASTILGLMIFGLIGIGGAFMLRFL